ncbi:hypothetical protein GTA08_BOTSDO08965 [Botryosphaeria dothidea]|uniref:F-box domain-containing protein n=1 Tax=Botryosphaeria dothidea TaxID=55169 RepID=A0A8H4IL82_9PEZI|nr:hypothetical protein GTA08_BOTSDO08965 [Botryosphaeria dothidea]
MSTMPAPPRMKPRPFPPTATARDNTAPPYSTTHLLSLPRELRNMIYEEHIRLIGATAIPRSAMGFACTRPLTHYSSSVIKKVAELSEMNLSIRLVCRQLAAEYADAFERRFVYSQYVDVNHTPHVKRPQSLFERHTFLVGPPKASPPFASKRAVRKGPALLIRADTLFGQDKLTTINFPSHVNPLRFLEMRLDKIGLNVSLFCSTLDSLEELTVTLCLRNTKKGLRKQRDLSYSGQRTFPGFSVDRFLARPADTLPLPKSLKKIESRIVVPYCAELPVRESVRERSNSTEEFVEVSSCERDGMFIRYIDDSRKSEDPISLIDKDWAEGTTERCGHEPTTRDWEWGRMWCANKWEASKKRGRINGAVVPGWVMR